MANEAKWQAKTIQLNGVVYYVVIREAAGVCEADAVRSLAEAQAEAERRNEPPKWRTFLHDSGFWTVTKDRCTREQAEVAAQRLNTPEVVVTPWVVGDYGNDYRLVCNGNALRSSFGVLVFSQETANEIRDQLNAAMGLTASVAAKVEG